MKTIVNVIPAGERLTIEVHNEHCFLRVAEPNNHIIFRLIKTNIRLWLKTIGKLARKNLTSK